MRLRAFGYEPRGAPFSAHLTLAPIKDALEARTASVRDALARRQRLRAPIARHAATIFRATCLRSGPATSPIAFARTES